MTRRFGGETFVVCWNFRVDEFCSESTLWGWLIGSRSVCMSRLSGEREYRGGTIIYHERALQVYYTNFPVLLMFL